MKAETPVERRGDWLASALWALLPLGACMGAAALAMLADQRGVAALLGLPLVLPGLVMLLVAAGVLPLRWAELLFDLVSPDGQVAILLALSALAWWAFLTACVYPVRRARRINRSVARHLGRSAALRFQGAP